VFVALSPNRFPHSTALPAELTAGDTSEFSRSLSTPFSRAAHPHGRLGTGDP